MSAGGELRESVALLVSEWRLLALGLGGPLVYGTWVVLTGLVLDIGTPALKRAVATTVAGTPVRGLELFALLGWVVLPSLVAIAAVQRQLFNRHDNLANGYRMAEPGVLLVVPSVALVACLVALVVTGWSLPLVFALLVVTVHFLVRTAAFGYRVYTLSLPRTLLAMIGISAVSLVVGLLVRLPSVAARDPRLASRVTLAGVADAVQTWTTLLGVDQGLLLRGTLFVPIVLSTCYLLAQTTAASIAKRRGLPTAPKRRPGQRVPESAQPAAATSDTRVVSAAETEQPDSEPDEMQDTVVAEPEPTATDESDSAPSTASTGANGTPATATTEPESNGATADEDDHTGTRVFSPNEPVPSAGGDGSPADPFADDDTAAEHDSSESPAEAGQQDPDQDDAASTPTSSTETDAVEEQTVVVDEAPAPTDTAADAPATPDTNGSASADGSTATDPAATNRPVVPTFEAAPENSDDERVDAGRASDSSAVAAAPVLPRFEPVGEYTDVGDDTAVTEPVTTTSEVLPRFESVSEYDRTGDDTEATVSRGDVLPRFELSETARANHADDAADRRGPKVLPVFETAADSGQSVTRSRHTDGREQRGDVLPRFEPTPADDGTVERAVRQRKDVVSVFEAAAETDSSAGVSDSRAGDGDAIQNDAATDTGEDQSSADPETIDCQSCGRSVRNSTDICYCPGCGTALER